MPQRADFQTPTQLRRVPARSAGTCGSRTPDGDDPRSSRAASTLEADGPRPTADIFRGKCPYLAGRPPHGSHHAGPSRVNVCYAQPREEKPYRPVSKEQQAERCFCGREVYESCSEFRTACQRGLELPRFDGKAAASPAIPDDEPRPHRRRERLKRHRRRFSLREWLAKSNQSRAACILWLLVMAGAFWLVLRAP